MTRTIAEIHPPDPKEREVNLSEAQRDAMRELGETPSGHSFISPEVVEELLTMDLVYWWTPDDFDFTLAGKKVLNEMVGK
jgi:hypothetical protein